MTFIGSASGCAYFTHQKQFVVVPPTGWRLESLEIPEWEQELMFVSEPDSFSVALPYSLLVVVSAVTIAVSWVSPTYRFSLRSLFIITTLLAIGLGLAVWAAR